MLATDVEGGGAFHLWFCAWSAGVFLEAASRHQEQVFLCRIGQMRQSGVLQDGVLCYRLIPL